MIDDAIVVLENIYRFMEEKGMPPMQAAIEGTKEIGLAVMATTLSLVAIFVPVGFMGGMVGRFLQSFGITMAFAVMVSLLVSFTLTPMMSSRWLKVKPRTEDEEHHVHDSKHSALFGPIDRVYARLLDWSMDHRGWWPAVAVLVLLSSVPLFRIVPVNFTPQDDTSEFEVTMRAPEGTSLDATDVLANRVATAIRRLPEVSYTMATVAGDGATTRNSAIGVREAEEPGRTRPQRVRRRARRCAAPCIPQIVPKEVRTSVAATGGIGGGRGGGGAGRHPVRDAGPRPGQAADRKPAADRRWRAAIPGLVDVDTNLNTGKPEMAVRLDRPKAADLGVQVSDAAEALRLLVGGDQVTTYNEGGEQYEVHVRAGERDRTSRAGRGAAAGAVVAAGQRDAGQHRDLRVRFRADRDPPAESPASGDGGRQHAAGHVAGRRAAGAARGVERAGPRPRVPAPGSPAARAS